MSALFSIDYETDILCCMMENPNAVEIVTAVVTEQDFYLPQHGALFRAIVWLSQNNQPHDALGVIHFLGKHGKLEAIGGDGFVAAIIHHGSISSVNLTPKAEEVRRLSTGRHLMAACQRIAEMVENPTLGTTIESILDQAESAILSIKDGQAKESDSGPRLLRDVVQSTLDVLDSRVTGGSAMGLDTGFTELNSLLLGLHKKTLTIVAGVPGSGKTTFAMNMLENAMKAKSCEGAAVIFSMEMSDTDIVERMLSSVGGVNQHSLRTSEIDDIGWQRITNVMTTMNEWPLYIDETSSLNLMEMRTRLRRIARKNGGKIGAVLVDYLQLMRSVERQPDRQREVAEIAVGLKSLSKEFDCPVVALSQLSRKVSDRPNKRPLMSDLRESGYIEQAADVILMIYRDEKHNLESKERGLAEIIIAKQRKGVADRKVLLAFDGAHSRFVDYIPGGYGHDMY